MSIDGKEPDLKVIEQRWFGLKKDSPVQLSRTGLGVGSGELYKRHTISRSLDQAQGGNHQSQRDGGSCKEMVSLRMKKSRKRQFFLK